jgi:hypothetical protein
VKRLHTSGLRGAVLALVLLLGVAAAGCGGTLSSSQATADPSTPLGMFQSALVNLGQMPTVTGDINATVTITGDPATMPVAAQLVFGQPIPISGTYSYDKSAKTFQANLAVSLAGQSIPVAIEAVNGQAYLQFMGQWYQLPMDTEALTGGLDPSGWLTNVQSVGDETVKGTTASHLSATVDVSKMAPDLAKLRSSTTSSSVTSGGATSTSAAESTGSITAAIQSLTLDAWVTKDTHQPVQVEVKANIVPPAPSTQGGSTASGIAQNIKNVSFDATVSIAPATTPVTVTAPTDAKPWSDLQATLQGYMSLFSGGLGGGSTSTSGQ